MDASSKPVVRSDIEYYELEDGGVVRDTSADRIHTLNVTAAYIWSCLDGSFSVQEIASDIHQRSHVAMEAALNDVREAITYFQNEGLLRSQ